MHRLLLRQLRKAFSGPDEIPASIDPLLSLVDSAYSQYDDDLEMLHRSLELSSAELVQRNAEMRAVFQAFPDTFLWVDAEGLVLDCRGGSGDVLCLVPELTRGCPVWELPIACGQEHCAAIFARFRAESASQHAEYTVEFGGHVRHYEARLVSLVDGVTLVILRNITERKRTELHLESSRRQFRNIIEFLPDPTFVVDADGRIIAWNKAIERLTGVDKAAVLGRGSHEYALPLYGIRRSGLLGMLAESPEEQRRRARELGYENLERTGDTLVAETFLPGVYAGRGADVRITAAPLPERDGSPGGAIECLRDITTRRRNERITAALYRISRAAGANPDLDALYRTIHEAIRTVTEVPNLFIALADQERDRLVFPFFSDERDERPEIRGLNAPEADSPTLRVLRSGKPVRLTGAEIRSAMDSGEMRLHGSLPRHWLGLPLTLRGRAIGVLAVQRYGEDAPFSDEDELFLSMVADSVALAIRRRRAEEALAASEAKYRSIFEHASEGIFQTGMDGAILSANPSFARIFGYADMDELIREVRITDLYATPENRERLLQRLLNGEVLVNYEGQARRRDGRLIWLSLNIRLVRGEDGKPSFLEGTFEDITARKLSEEQLTHQALHDALTGLPNRTLFMDRLERAIKRRQRHGLAYAVLLVDLDRFKRVNDSLGHIAGDRLLVEVGQRLFDCVREMDTVARLGGDEFALILEEFQSPQEALQIVRRIQDVLQKPFRIAGGEVVLTASIGLVLRTEEYDLPEDVLRDADISMYRAKETGRNRYAVFDKDMHMRALRVVEVENELRRGIQEHEFFVVYQPIHRIDGVLHGFEALVRWRHPERGVVPPIEFIPVAEESGLIRELGLQVLETACRTLARWNRRREDRRVSVSVNLSRRQLAQPQLVHHVAEVLRGSLLDPGLLTLEVTETAIMDNPEQALQRLRMLKDLGLRLSVDDFGTGYSSLAYLQRFPVDVLKVDQAFVKHMAEDQESREIVRAVIALGHSLQLRAVAEGVETQAQYDLLREMNCDLVQGYLFNRPLPEEEAEALLERS